ncbi:MAG: TatD family hydrolase [Clostridia bacterium]|jgi:TatD DNase family protein|nr:TatD family hydrolase [Clostridia bacterium]
MYIDTHAHLNDERLLPLVQQIAADMDKDQLSHVINVGWDLNSSKKAIEIAEKNESMFAIIGIHPHDSSKTEQNDYKLLYDFSKNKKVVGYGEIGLDFFHNLSPKEIQEKVFKDQIEIAFSAKLPLVLHVREAYQLAYDILKEMNKFLDYGLVLHCYSGSSDMVKKFSEFDAYFSLGGAITFKNAKKENVASEIPEERLLLETDCPYMTPVPKRGEVNYPKYIKYVGDKLAEWFPDRDIARTTSDNALRIFSRMR